jgi:hypothetical protein
VELDKYGDDEEISAMEYRSNCGSSYYKFG